MLRVRPRVGDGDERGAVAVLTAAVTVVLVTVAALVVDVGVQRVARTDMQTLADMVALDLSRELGAGRTVSQLQGATPSIQDLADQSRDRNAGTIGGRASVTPELGTVDPTGAFTAGAGSDVPNAVRVSATTTVGFSFGVVRSGRATRQAVSAAQPRACFTLGSFGIGLDSDPSILRALLGQAASVRVLSYTGVTDPRVSLLGLGANLGVATPQALLSLPGLTVGQFLLASSTVLGQQGDSTASLFLAGLATDLGPLASKPLNLAQQVRIGQGNGSALAADLDVLDLVGGALVLANGGNALTLGLGVPGVTDVRLTVVQKPQTACDDQEAQTSQVSLAATVSVLGLVKVRLKVGLAEGRGRLTSISCTDGKVTSLAVSVHDQSLTRLQVSASVLSGTPPDPVLAPSSPPAHAPYVLPLDASYTTPVTTDGGSVGLSSTDLDVAVAGLSLGPASDLLLKPVLLPTVDALLKSLLGVLGVDVAGADVYAVRTPSCASPRLVG